MRAPLSFINPLLRHQALPVLQHPTQTLSRTLHSRRFYTMSSSTNFSLNTTIKLSSGYSMPLLGLGVFQNPGASVVPACIAATEAGYRHIDSAQAYSNEKEVAEAVEKSGLKREELFVSESCYPASLKRSRFRMYSLLSFFFIHHQLLRSYRRTTP